MKPRRIEIKSGKPPAAGDKIRTIDQAKSA
jgi:hypothetical protein